MSYQTRHGFWSEAFVLHGSIFPLVLPRVLVFALLSAVICVVAPAVERQFGVRIVLGITPFEFAGAALGVLLVFRTNAGYERWWEARKLWGGFVDRSRNFAISALAYGPNDAKWREQLARWAASYSHVARHSLRGERPASEVINLVGPENGNKSATHSTCRVSSPGNSRVCCAMPASD
jgi:putative membrane protein